MIFFSYKKSMYPLFAVLSALLIMVFGLVSARSVNASYFLIGIFIWLLAFGCFKQCAKILPLFIVFGGLFAMIAYFTSGGNPVSALAMANRFGAVFLAIVPGMSIQAVAMTRNLSALHTPRGITLGMLIVMSFIPVLTTEIKRVREAMKTRGAGSILNPRIFYRALLIPLVTRLVDISDTLALSIETRGFTFEKGEYTVCKKETINIYDVLYVLGILTGGILAVVL